MKTHLCRTGIAVFVLLTLSACVSQERPWHSAHGSKQCRLPDTLTCEKFADETYNCTCQKGDNLRDILDSNRSPDY